MKIKYHRKFKKHFKKLPLDLREKTVFAVERFGRDPFDPGLRNHALKGKLAGKRAFSVTGDVRVIFEEFDDYFLVVMLDVGGHGRVY